MRTRESESLSPFCEGLAPAKVFLRLHLWPSNSEHESRAPSGLHHRLRSQRDSDLSRAIAMTVEGKHGSLGAYSASYCLLVPLRTYSFYSVSTRIS